MNHIGEEMRNLLIKKIIASESKIGLIIDDVLTISQKSVLILYFHVFLQDIDVKEPVKSFH